MKRLSLIVILFLSMYKTFLFAEIEKFYFDQERLFLHERINYSFDHNEDMQWQKHRIKSNGIRLTYGSVGTIDLMEHKEILFNHELSDNFSFRYEYSNYKGRIFTTDQEFNALMLLYKIYESLETGFIVNPVVTKEDMDLGLNMLFYNEAKDNYLNLYIIAEDLLFNPRNREEGHQKNFPLNFRWNLLKNYYNFTVYLEGTTGNGFKRIFNNPLSYDGKIQQSKRLSHFNNNIIYTLNPFINLHLSNRYYFYSDKTDNYFIEDCYSLKQKTFENSIKTECILSDKISIISGVNLVNLYLKYDNIYNYNIKRTDLMPEIRFNYHTNYIDYSLSYFSSIYNINGEDNFYKFSQVSNKGYEDKVELSTEIFFNELSKLRISLSHVASVNGFGGGNIRYIMNF